MAVLKKILVLRSWPDHRHLAERAIGQMAGEALRNLSEVTVQLRRWRRKDRPGNGTVRARRWVSDAQHAE